MSSFELTYRPYSEDAILVQWPKEINEAILLDINAFKNALAKPYPKAILTAAYCELLIRFPELIKDFPLLIADLKNVYLQREASHFKRHLIKIPVCYEDEFGEDQQEVCKDLHLSHKELVQLHTRARYTVYAIGFLPGFMYLGGLDPKLHHARKTHPRNKVPRGAVGLAGMQTGIYPNESPGGWQLIGNTPLDLFRIDHLPPSFVNVGDKIQFYPIGKDEYDLIRIQVETDLYEIQKEALL